MEARWQAWLVENLLLGVPDSDLLAPLEEAGHSRAEVEAEVAAARAHPYLQGALKVAGRLARREWLLRTLTTLSNLDPVRLEALPFPSREGFLREHYARSLPGYFPGAASDWSALAWSPAALSERFGDRTVEVQWGRGGDPLYEPHSNNYRRKVTFRELGEAIAAGPSNDVYLTANNSRANAWLIEELSPELGSLGPVGEILDPARLVEGTFLWVGPQGVVTPLHHDLTNNLFVQVSGRKRFYLASSLQVDALYNHHHVYSTACLREPDLETCPEMARVRTLEVELGPGDVLYLPVGWWHEVVGSTPSTSLTFTGFRWPNDFPRASESL
ncbi:MAG: cupin-like domain-containing protein [Planctomycetes bacterium]|nr:cupin-like domain-containing protein [Planctomycetota bacterium]